MKKVENNELDLNANISVIKFGAPWCGPCRVMEPVIESVEEELKADNVDFFDINVDNNQELAQKFSIRAVPTIIIARKKNDSEYEVLEFLTGVISKEDLVMKIKNALM